MRCKLIGVMQLDFALAYDDCRPALSCHVLAVVSRYHVGWDEKKKVVSLSNRLVNVIFALFMPRY